MNNDKSEWNRICIDDISLLINAITGDEPFEEPDMPFVVTREKEEQIKKSKLFLTDKSFKKKNKKRFKKGESTYEIDLNPENESEAEIEPETQDEAEVETENNPITEAPSSIVFYENDDKSDEINSSAEEDSKAEIESESEPETNDDFDHIIEEGKDNYDLDDVDDDHFDNMGRKVSINENDYE